MSAGAFVGIDACEAEALELRGALAGFGSVAVLPRDDNDPRLAASGVAELSEDSKDVVEDSMNSGDFRFVAGTTAFFFGIRRQHFRF